MNCKDARSRISRAIDAELPPEERPPLEEHIEECGNCRRFKEQCEKLQDALALAAPPQQPDSRADELCADLCRRLRGRRLQG